jgi:uncharacterized protein YbcV (DUF1398 family)
MNAPHAGIAQTCLDAAYDKTASFPEIIGKLLEAGFEGYLVDYRRNTTTYYLADGDRVVLENRASPEQVARTFDPPAVDCHRR